MENKRRRTPSARPGTRTVLIQALLLAGVALPAAASDWKITPRLSVGERYTDNVTLAPSGQEKSDLITEIRPGVSIGKSGARLQVNVDYALQTLWYANDSERNNVNHQLGARAKAELVEDFFFFDARSTISQQYRSLLAPVGIDNISATGNLTTVATYSLSPYIKHRFGSYASVEARYTFDEVLFDGAGLSDSTSNRFNLVAGGGPQLYPWSWNARFNKQQVNQRSAADSDTENGSVDLRYNLSRKYGLLTGAGYEQYNFQGVSPLLRDYSYWKAGAFFTPNRYFSVEAAYNDSSRGQFISGSVTWNPTVRTSLTAASSQRAFGRTHSLVASHRTRNATWSARYTEGLTTSRELQLVPFALGDIYDCNAVGITLPVVLPGGSAPPPGCTLLGSASAVSTSLVNETFLAKNFNTGVSYNMGKSTLALNVFNIRRELQLSGTRENQRGVRGNWDWRFAPRTTMRLVAGVSRMETGARNDDLWDIALGFTRQFQPRVTGTLDLRHQERSSSQPASDFKENSITARVNMTF